MPTISGLYPDFSPVISNLYPVLVVASVGLCCEETKMVLAQTESLKKLRKKGEPSAILSRIPLLDSSKFILHYSLQLSLS
jgi:hypothetical protein